MTRVRGWTDEQIRSLLENVKVRLDWKHTSAEVRQWWEFFEGENPHRLALVLRLAEELATRYVTLTQFYRSFGLAQTGDIQANLFYLDYLRLTTNTYTYETVVLDETGKVIERRFDEARHFFEELAPGIPLEMVEIPGGTFLMGAPDGEEGRSNDEGPQHEVTIWAFSIGKSTITQEQWNVVAGWEKVERDLKPDPSHFKGDNRPVETVSWFDATEFCARLTKKTGRQYRLPSESEWEYACRAETTTPFAFGETITPEFVNYNGDYPYAKAEKGEYRKETIDVGSLGVANGFGLFDMHGNVWEWCEDVWHGNYDGAPTDGSAWLSGGDSSRRVLRGGSWDANGVNCRSAGRLDLGPDDRGTYFGFRVVVVARTP
ncbi:MAG: formylglycine-generating enzyme family protein [Acidobacteria bacterium]|nr:formylglycine-generating enzyme family protein [Acidobacteriota bacterium]